MDHVRVRDGWVMRCAWCGEEFVARRRDALTCSGKCRTKWVRYGAPAQVVIREGRYVG